MERPVELVIQVDGGTGEIVEIAADRVAVGDRVLVRYYGVDGEYREDLWLVTGPTSERYLPDHRLGVLKA